MGLSKCSWPLSLLEIALCSIFRALFTFAPSMDAALKILLTNSLCQGSRRWLKALQSDAKAIVDAGVEMKSCS